MCTRNGDEISKADLGPLLDCIDIHIEVSRVYYEKLSRDRTGEMSESIHLESNIQEISAMRMRGGRAIFQVVGCRKMSIKMVL